MVDGFLLPSIVAIFRCRSSRFVSKFFETKTFHKPYPEHRLAGWLALKCVEIPDFSFNDETAEMKEKKNSKREKFLTRSIEVFLHSV
jgi:hypothetical protein